MGVLARRRIKQDLANVSTFIDDTLNQYIVVQEVPEKFTQGRTAFKIFGSPFLKKGVNLKIEILDRTGKTVYVEPVKYGQGATPQLQYTYVSVEVYDFNAPGEAMLTILATLDENAVPFDIPKEFIDTYNVRFQKSLHLELESIKNTAPILFFQEPTVEAVEIVKAAKKVNPPPNRFTSGSQIFGKVKADLLNVAFNDSGTSNIEINEQTLAGKEAQDKNDSQLRAEINAWKNKSGEYGKNTLLGKKGVKEDRVDSEPPQMTIFSNENPGPFFSKMVGAEMTIENIQLSDLQKGNLSGLKPEGTLTQEKINAQFLIGTDKANLTAPITASILPNFTARVETVISDTEITLTKPYSVDFLKFKTFEDEGKIQDTDQVKIYSDIGSQFSSVPNDETSGLYADFTSSYLDWGIPSTSSFQFFSFLDMKIKNMRTFSGDVYRIKVYGASDSGQSDFPVLLDTLVDSPEQLRDINSPSGQRRTGFFQSKEHADIYWTSDTGRYPSDNSESTSSFRLETAYTMDLSDGIFLSGSYENYNEAGRFELKQEYGFTVEKDTPHTLSFNAKATKTDKLDINGNSYKDAKLYIHLSGSGLVTDNDLTIPISASFGQLITNELNKAVGLQIETDSDSDPDTKDFKMVSHTFMPKFKLQQTKCTNAQLQFRIDSGNWTISDVSLRPATDTGFSPDSLEVRVPIPTIPTVRPDNFDFLIEYYDVDGKMAEAYTFLDNIAISGSALIISGDDNLLTGSLFIGNVQHAGIEAAGVNSAYVRSVGYIGFASASIGHPTSSLSAGDNTGYGGFLMWSGSVLPDAPDNYTGAGLEIHDGISGEDESYFKFRTNPSEFDVKTKTFFLGSSTAGNFISGSNGNIEITSSNFHLQPDGDVIMQGTITAEAGGTLGGFSIGASSLHAGGTEETPSFFISGSAGGGLGMGKSNLFVSSSGFQVNAQGRISASAGVIGGFSIGKNSISSSNLIINAADGEILTTNYESGFKGWRITAGIYGGLDSNGSAEFENVKIRGTMRTAVFEKETVNAVGGQLLITNSTALSGSASAADTQLFCDNVSGFQIGEILFAKKVTGGGFTKEYMKVTSQSRVSASSGDDMTGILHVERGFGGDPTSSVFTSASFLKAAIETNQTSFNIFTADGGDADNNNTAATASASSLYHRTITIDDEIMRVSASSATDGKIYVYRGADGSRKSTHVSGSVIKAVDPNVAFLLGLSSPKESYTEGQVLVSTGRYITGSDGLTPGGGVSTVPAQGSGWIHVNANPTLAQTPYIDLFERTGSGIFDAKMKLRLGDLSGLHGTVLGKEVGIDRDSGFGLASENVYLSGLIKANSGSIGGILMEDNKLFTGEGVHGDTNTGFYIDSGSNFSLSNKFVFSGSDGSLSIKSANFNLSTPTVSMSSFDSGKLMMGTNLPSASGQDGILLSGSGFFSFQSSSAAFIRSDAAGFAMNFPSFSVDTAGRMSATEGTFKGHLEANTGFFGSSSNDGWNINANTIADSDNVIQIDATQFSENITITSGSFFAELVPNFSSADTILSAGGNTFSANLTAASMNTGNGVFSAGSTGNIDTDTEDLSAGEQLASALALFGGFSNATTPSVSTTLAGGSGIVDATLSGGTKVYKSTATIRVSIGVDANQNTNNSELFGNFAIIGSIALHLESDDSVVATQAINETVSIDLPFANTDVEQFSRSISAVFNHTVVTNTTDYYIKASGIKVTNSGITEQWVIGPKTFTAATDITGTAISFTAMSHQPSNKKVEIAPKGIQAVFLSNDTLLNAANKYFRVAPEEDKTVDILGTTAITGSLTMRTVGSTVGIKVNETAGRVSASHFIASGDSSFIRGPSGTEAVPAVQLGSANDGFYHLASGDVGINVIVDNEQAFLFGDNEAFHAGNDITAFSSTVASDIRLKENIKPLENNLDKILELKPSLFTWKVQDKQDDVGLIAQEVESVIPMIVKENISIGKTKKFLNGDTHKTVDYSKLTTYLIGAVQEQQAQIDELKKKLEEL